MKKINTEFKVGIFVVLGLIILSTIVFQIGGLNIFNANIYKLNVIFDFVSGVQRNSPVHFAGVAIGDVEDVEIFYNNNKNKTQVKLILRIKKEVKIPKDSLAYINTLGILGEKYVEIYPGKDRGNFLQNGDQIRGSNPVQMEKLTESLVDIVGDQKVRDSLKESFINFRIATENLRQTSETIKEIVLSVQQGQGTMGKLLTDKSIYDKTEGMIVNLDKSLQKTIMDLNTQLNELVSDLKHHPWKLFQKPPRIKAKKTTKKEKEKQESASEEEGNKGYIHKTP